MSDTQIILTRPDTSSLPALNADAMLALRVIDDATKAQAIANAKSAKTFIGLVEGLFKRSVDAAFAAHRELTALRGTFTATATQVDQHCRKEIAAYDERLEQARLKLQRELQAKAEAEARERAEAERQRQIAEAQARAQEAAKLASEAVADLAPWELEDAEAVVAQAQAEVDAIAAAPLVVEAPQIVVPQAPAIGGSGSRASALKYKVVDIHLLIQAAVQNPALADYLEVNDTMVKAKLKTVGEKLGAFLPGLETYRDRVATIR